MRTNKFMDAKPYLKYIIFSLKSYDSYYENQ